MGEKMLTSSINLLFSECLQNVSFSEGSKTGYCLVVAFTLFQTIPRFYGLTKEGFENHVGIGEDAGNQHFLIFLQSFFSLSKTEIITSATFNFSSANGLILVKAKILSFGKGLNLKM